jgi:hypothetical protein
MPADNATNIELLLGHSIGVSVYNLQFLEQNMFVIPVAFGKEHKHMLAHCKELMGCIR